MPVTSELLKQMLEAYGGIPMDDQELEDAVKVVNGYLLQVDTAREADVSAVYSGRLVRLPLRPPDAAG